jgi:hypothetical protein
VSGQQTGHWYYRVQASNAGGDSPWSNIGLVTVAPPAPTLYAISNADGNGSYTVDWNDVTEVSGYELQEDDDPAFDSPTERYSGTESRFRVTEQGTGLWYYRVRATSSSYGNSQWSNTESVGVLPDVPTLAPIDNADGDGEYLVQWDDVVGVVGYELQEDDNPDFTSPALRYNGTNTEYQVRARPTGRWYYRVRANNAGGDGAWSNVESAGVLPATPELAPISNPELDGEYLVDWSDVTGATSYELQEADNAAFAAAALRHNGPDSHYQVTAQDGGLWHYRVRSRNAGGDSPWSNTVSVGVLPATPELLPINNDDEDSSYLVAWTAVAGATGYRLQEDDSPDFDSPVTRYQGPATQFTVGGRPPGAEYYYRVQAYNQVGDSPWSVTQWASVAVARAFMPLILSGYGTGP